MAHNQTTIYYDYICPYSYQVLMRLRRLSQAGYVVHTRAGAAQSRRQASVRCGTTTPQGDHGRRVVAGGRRCRKVNSDTGSHQRWVICLT